MAPNFPFEMSTLCVLLILLLSQNTRAKYEEKIAKVLLPVNGSTVSVKVNGSRKLSIYCYPGQERTWTQVFTNPQLAVEPWNECKDSTTFSSQADITIYYGRNESEVKDAADSTLSFQFNWKIWRNILNLSVEHSFPPFNYSCVGVSSDKCYKVLFHIKNPELWYIASVVVGIMIFSCAPSWSRNTTFHYGTGVSVGVLASLLIVVFILTRLMPQRLKTLSYTVMVVSSSASLFLLQYVKNYLHDIMTEHWQILLGYVAVAAVLSFAVVHRFGPVTDARTLDLVQWILQGVGLFIIYQGTQIPEASTAIIIIVLTIYFSPRSLPWWMKSLRYRLFRPQHRFLTEQEYIQEGEVETRRALEHLREYCHSPDCNAWRMISRLQSPARFAKFIEGDSHVSDDEVTDHEAFIPMDDYTDVSDEDNSDSGSEHNGASHLSDIRAYPVVSDNGDSRRHNGIGYLRHPS